MTRPARFFLQTANYGRGVDVRLAQLNFDGDVVAEAVPVTWREVDPRMAIGDEPNSPLLTISRDAAQNLIDELWFLGYRPEGGQMSVGQAAATGKHLEDMRAIAFAKLEVAKP